MKTESSSTSTANTAIDPKTVKVHLKPLVAGYPNIIDNAGNFMKSLNQAKAGGTSTQDYFNSRNQTSGFWNWMADHNTSGNDPFAPAVDPQGNKIVMASNGNVDMRMGSFYREPENGEGHVADENDPPIFGIATIQTGNTTSLTSRDVSFALGLIGIPGGIVLTKALFGDLLTPVYKNMKTFVTKMASKFRDSSNVEDPDIDPETESEEPLDDASGQIENVGGELGEEGAEYLAIDWSSVGLEAAGLGAIVAIPMIVDFLGHKMVNSVEVHNLTNSDLTWYIDKQVHGKSSVAPKPESGGNIIPKMDYNVDQWGDKTTVKVAYAADFQFINSSDLGSIGYVLSFTPSGQTTPIKAVVSVPWAGHNAIWAGESSESADDIYNKYAWVDTSQPAPANWDKTTWSSVVGDYKVTISITKLSGETEGQYFYGNVIVIEPKDN